MKKLTLFNIVGLEATAIMYILMLYTINKALPTTVFGITEFILISFFSTFFSLYLVVYLVEFVFQKELSNKVKNYLVIFSPLIWSILVIT